MPTDSNDSISERFPVRRRTVVGTLAAGAGLGALGSAASDQSRAQAGQVGVGADGPDWLPPEVSEAHVAVLSGHQADVGTDASGCVHVTPTEEEDTLVVDLVLEDIQCVTQAHIHEGGRGEDGPIVAPLLEYTEEPDGSGDGDPLTTEPDTPLIAGETVDDPELVQAILTDPGEYYVNVHTVHNPGGEIRGQIRGFDHGMETDIEPEPAEFVVSNLEPQDATVVQGATVDVSATVRNDGDVADTQTVELRIDGGLVADRELELGCRRSTTVVFEDVATADLDPGEYEHVVSTDDDSETGTLRVLEPPEFVVSALDPEEATVTRGDLLDVSASVENVGEATGTQTVQLRIDDETVADRELELEGAESETVVFEDVETADLESGEHEHGVFTEDDSETGTLTVQTPPEFAVSDLDPQEVTVAQGDLIDVSASVENVGEATGTQTVQLRIDDETVADQELELEGAEAATVVFEDVDTADLEPGEYEHGVFTADDSETGTLTVELEGDEDGEEENGTPEDGTPEDGTPDDGTPDDGTPENGTPDDGAPEDGTPDNGTPDNGTPGGETPENGTPENGTPTEEDGTNSA